MQHMRRLVTLVLLAVVSLAPVPAAHATASRVYAALGDSYASGPLVPDQIARAGACLRSDHDYAHVAAAALGAQLRDVSCIGAATDDLVRPESLLGWTNPPQLDAVRADTTVVTVQIGGNDIDFAGIVAHCLDPLPTATRCRDRYVRAGSDTLAARIAALAPKLAHILDLVHARAPRAVVLALGYPEILPDRGSGCWPSIPISPVDVAYLRATERLLDASIAGVAARHGARYADLYGPSLGHDACAPRAVRWVEPIVPAHLAAPIHPNAAGMRAFAALVLRSATRPA